MAYGHKYRVRHRATVSTAITILQVKAGATAPFEVLRAWCNQDSSATSAVVRVQLLRKSGAATVTTGVVGTHVFKLSEGDPTPSLSLGTSATGVIGTAEGTDGDVLDDAGFNNLAGWEWVRTYDGHIIVPAAGIIALKFGTAPASHSFDFGMDIRELGT